MGLSIDAVIGRNLAELRQSHGLSQDDVAGAARLFGLRWNSARISRMERGDGAVTVETLLSLCVVMSEATDSPVGMPDLLATTDAIQISPDATVPARNVSMIVSTDPDYWAPEDEPSPPEAPMSASRPSDIQAIWAAYERIVSPGPMNLATLNPIVNARRAWSLTDERNARKLGLSDEDFLVWCFRLWGQLMSAETEARAPEGATAQKRGRITRELLAELQDAMDASREP